MALVSLLLGSVLLAGCGGDSSELTHEEFVTQGNAICAQGNEQIDAGGETAFDSPGNPTEAEIVAFAKTVVLPAVQGQLDQLRALSPPKEEEARVEEILGKAQAAVDEVRANPALLAGANGFEEANRLAKAYGLTACAE